MFWKIIRWGGTIVMVVVAVIAIYASQGGSSHSPAPQQNEGIKLG